MSPETIWGALSTAVAILFGLLIKGKNDRIQELKVELADEKACNDELTEKVEKLMTARYGRRPVGNREDRVAHAKDDLTSMTMEATGEV